MNDSANSNGVPAIDLVRAAVATWLEEIKQPGDEGAILTTAVIVYETSTMDLDGSGVVYESNYAVITDTSMSSAVGLMTVGKRMLLDDALDGSLEEDD